MSGVCPGVGRGGGCRHGGGVGEGSLHSSVACPSNAMARRQGMWSWQK